MPTTFEIHPSIGIARVGDSQAADGFFLAPEPGSARPASFRDQNGDLLKQAARFRIFKCERDANNQITSAEEITLASASIEWRVTVANRKACAPLLVGHGRRNNAQSGDDPDLSIKPSPRTLNAAGSSAAFDDGKFRGLTVPLGEARMDNDGRLIFIPARGHADSNPAGVDLQTFADNFDWFDDIADGVIEARVTIGGATQTAKPAWVVVAPPDFAPEIENIVSWYDVALHAAIERGFITAPSRPSFQHHIRPILERFVQLQWTNPIFLQQFGPGSPRDFAAKMAALADPAQEQQTRQAFFAALRRPGSPPNPAAGHIPRLNDDRNDKDTLTLTPTQFRFIEQWAAGDFVSDLGAQAPAEQLPDALDRVSLQACVGGAFFPGIEAGRIIADPQSYSEPFRLDAAQLKPGSLTAGNAVPWQADFMACKTDISLAWWPAQRPDRVFIDPNHTGTVGQMKRWMEPINEVTEDDGLIKNYGKLGIIVRETNQAGATVFVERERKLPPH
jgi:hypothetical protein